MSNYAKGEQVTSSATQTNEAGEIISEVSVTWYGNANADANAMSMDLVMAAFNAANGWREGKASGKRPSDK